MANEYSESTKYDWALEIIHEAAITALNILMWEITGENERVITARMGKQLWSNGNYIFIMIMSDGTVKASSNCTQWQMNGTRINRKHVEQFFETLERVHTLMDVDKSQIIEKNDEQNEVEELHNFIKKYIDDIEYIADNLTIPKLYKIKHFIETMSVGEVIVLRDNHVKLIECERFEKLKKEGLLDGFTVLYEHK
jgi:hypothetical protein